VKRTTERSSIMPEDLPDKVTDAGVRDVTAYVMQIAKWIIVRGNTLVHVLNGHAITITTDDDPMRRAFQGILSLQCEGGAIWYRNVYLKHLEPIVK
jgi:hypothetical protein